MGHNENIIARMQLAASGQTELGEHELRAISSQAQRIADDMVANHGMNPETAHQLWEHAISAARKSRISVKMPTIVDTSRLDPELLTATMGGFVDREAERGELQGAYLQ